VRHRTIIALEGLVLASPPRVSRERAPLLLPHGPHGIPEGSRLTAGGRGLLPHGILEGPPHGRRHQRGLLPQGILEGSCLTASHGAPASRPPRGLPPHGRRQRAPCLTASHGAPASRPPRGLPPHGRRQRAPASRHHHGRR